MACTCLPPERLLEELSASGEVLQRVGVGDVRHQRVLGGGDQELLGGLLGL